MRLSKQHGSHKVMLNITPLIDIVFLLIIFFITVAQITKVNEERLQLPKLKGDQDQEPTTVTININTAGEITISGSRRSVAETVVLVGNELASVGNDPRLVRVMIRCDRMSSNETLHELIRQFKQMDITQVRYAVESGS
jgi:biopolymer transport protein ExbD